MFFVTATISSLPVTWISDSHGSYIQFAAYANKAILPACFSVSVPSGPSTEMRGMHRRTPSKVLFIALFTVLGAVLVVTALRTLGDLTLPGARAGNFTVNVTFDEFDGDCATDCSLRDAIILANGNGQVDTITLGAHTYILSITGQNEDAGATGDLDITAPLTITGLGPELTFIDADDIDRVFDVRYGAGEVVLSDLTVSNGSVAPPYRGGGIANADANLYLLNTRVQDSSAWQGGGVYVGDGSATISGGEISDNYAIDGGGLFVATGSATLSGSRILRNTSGNPAQGSGLLTAHWASGDIDMSGGCIVNNSDYSVYPIGGGTVSATDVWWGSVSGPSGVGPGAGDSVGSGVTYTPFATTAGDCPVRADETYTVTITTDEIDGECGVDCSLRDAIILANTTTAPDLITVGDGIYTLSIPGQNENACTTGDLDITEFLTIYGAGPDRTFIDADGLDRVFDLRPGAGVVVISGATMLNGSVTGFNRGGGVSNADANLYLLNTRVQDNSAFQGGGVYVGDGSATISGGEISDNYAIDGGGLFVATGSATLSGGRFLRNTTFYPDRGAGLLTAYWANGDIDMSGGCIVNNLYGAVVHSGSGTLGATDVWWGSISGPSGVGPGVGDSVGTGVTYNPFATAGNGCPPRANAWVYPPVTMR